MRTKNGWEPGGGRGGGGAPPLLRWLLLTLALLVLLAAPARAGDDDFAGGSGTEADPYLIATPDQLYQVRNYLDSHFRLANHIYLGSFGVLHTGGVGWEPIGTEGAPFNGSLDGAGHTISGLSMNRATNDVGLFGVVGATGVVTDLHLAAVDVRGGGQNTGALAGQILAGGAVRGSSATGAVSGNRYTGGLVGVGYGAISDSWAAVTVTSSGDRAGGLVARLDGTVTRSFATGSVSAGTTRAGGLVGVVNAGTVTDSYATGHVTGGTSHVGGLVGENFGAVFRSYATGKVTSPQAVGGLIGTNSGLVSLSYATGAVENTPSRDAGGLVGYNYRSSSFIIDSYATGAVAGSTGVGGLVGRNEGILRNSYAAGSVGGDSAVGGLVGAQESGSITASYWNTDVAGPTGVGEGDGTGASGKSTAEMRQQASFSGWDFPHLWQIAEGQAYPFHAWQLYGGGGPFAGGDGSADAPYEIVTAAQLNQVRYYLDSHFVVRADIDLGEYGADYAGGQGWEPIGTDPQPFTGSLDGAGHTITGLYINRGTDYVGLFGVISGLQGIAQGVGRVENIHLTGVSVQSGGKYTGALAGRVMRGGTVRNSSAAGSVSSTRDYTGGLVGAVINNSTIAGSHATGSVKGDGARTGGLVGYFVSGTITDSYATGDVTGADTVGGLVGYQANSGTVANSYAAGQVTGTSNVGGLVGDANSGTITASYWNTDAAGARGVSSGVQDPPGVTGLTTAQMKQQASFDDDAGADDWDFAGTWAIVDGQTYPYAAWLQSVQDLAPPGFTAGFPAAANVGDSAFDLQVQTDEAGTVHYVVLAGGANAPTAAQVQAGRDAGDTPLPDDRRGSLDVGAGLPGTAAISGLTPATDYDIYLVTVDGEGNLSRTPTLREVTTLAPQPVLSVEPDAVYEGAGFDQTFTLSLVNDSFADLLDAGHISLGGDFDPEDLAVALTRDGDQQATVRLTGNLAHDTGTGTITVSADGLAGDVALSASVTVHEVIDAELSAETVDFDGDDPQPVEVTITWNSTTQVTAVRKGGDALAAGDHYTVAGNTLTINRDYVESQLPGDVVLTVEFNRGAPATLTIRDITNYSGFTVILAVDGDKTAGVAFDLNITGATDEDGADLAGDITVRVNSNLEGADPEHEVYNDQVTFTNGDASVTIILTKAGTHTLTVAVDGVTDSPTLDVTVVAAAAHGLTVAADPESLPPGGNQTATITATVTDEFGNPVSGVAVSFGLETGAGNLSDDTATTDENGAATTVYTTGAGDNGQTVRVTASVDGIDPDATAQAVVFGISDRTDPPDGKVFQGYNYGFEAVGGVPPYSFDVTDGELPPGLTLEEDGVLSGLPTAAGDYTFTLTVTDSSNPALSDSHTFTLTILPGVADLTIHADPVSVDEGGGQTVNVRAEARDAFGFPVAGVQVTFSHNGAGSFNPDTATTNGDGEATTVYTTAPEDDGKEVTLTAQVPGTPLVGTIKIRVAVIDAELEPATASFDHNDPQDVTVGIHWNSATAVTAVWKGDDALADGDYDVDYDNDTLTISGDYLENLPPGDVVLTVVFDVGEPATLTIEDDTDYSGFTVNLAEDGGKTAGEAFDLDITGARDTRGDLLNGDITVRVTSDVDGEVHNSQVPFTDGAASVPITLTAAGPHTLTVTVDGVTESQTLGVNVVVAAPQGLTVAVAPTSLPPGAGHEATVTATVTDAYGNPVSGVQIDFSHNGSGGLSPPGDSTGGDGKAVTTYTTGPGDNGQTVTLTAQVAGSEIGAAAAQTVVFGITDRSNPPNGKVAAEYSHFFAAAGGALPYSFEVTEGTLPQGLTLAVDGNLEGEPVTAGVYRFTVTVTDSSEPALSDSHSFTLTILPNPAGITVAAQPASVGAGGGRTVTVTATVTDPLGNPVSGMQVNFSHNGSGSLSANSATTDANGAARAVYTTAPADNGQTVTVTAAVEGTEVDGTAQINVLSFDSGGDDSGGDDSGGGGDDSGGGEPEPQPEPEPEPQPEEEPEQAPEEEPELEPGPEPQSAPDYMAEVVGTDLLLPVATDLAAGQATVGLDTAATAALSGIEAPVILVPAVPDVDAYSLSLPAAALTGAHAPGPITLVTAAGSITLPGNMLAAVGSATEAPAGSAREAAVTIGRADPASLPEEVRQAVGDRPLVQLTLTLDGEPVAWQNPAAPVTVSISYTPTAEELADPEYIVVWHIDGAGNAVPVPSGRYDPATGMVTFTTTHFSYYAVTYVRKAFADLEHHPWAQKAVTVLASKGIIHGTGPHTYAPAAGVSRADYLVLLVRTLGLAAAFDSNFADVPPDAYYYEAVGIARRLGIAQGVGDNRFNPHATISRQDLMALTARALQRVGRLSAVAPAPTPPAPAPAPPAPAPAPPAPAPAPAGLAALDAFADKAEVAPYAAASLAALVEAGLVEGDGQRLHPRADTTRAEAAVLLYRIYNYLH